MLKKLALTLALVGFATYTYAQGTVNFDTLSLGGTARVYLPGATQDGTTNNAAAGTNFFAQLFAVDGTGGSEGSLVAVGNVVNLRAGGNAGYVQTTGVFPAGPRAGQTLDPVVQVTAVLNGPVTLQLRVWSSSAGLSYQTATTTPGALVGKSNLISLNATGGGAITPPQLTGLNGFVLTQVAPIPEPSTIALGLLGAGSLLFLRRKK